MPLLARLSRGSLGRFRPSGGSLRGLSADPPSNQRDPPKNNRDPPKNNLDPPKNNRDPPKNNLDPPKNNRDPSSNNQDPPKNQRDPPQDQVGGRGRERPVPVSRVGRAAAMGGLALELGLGALAEAARTRLRGQERPRGRGSSPPLSEATAERLVAALGRARGAALKLGQLLSMADSALLTPQLQRILARLRQDADPMPRWQSQAVLDAELGPAWREQLQEFQEFPVAAASLGQVHWGRLRSGAEVAIKVQYPGVARSIGSDIENLLTLLSLSPGLPRGLFAAQSLRALQRELELECDYHREAQNAQRFRSLLASDGFFLVPGVVPELSSRRVLCTHWARGESLERCRALPQERRDQICSELLRLCLLELFQFRFMQSDPNWANFLYEPRSNTVTLLDFGACRSFEREFTDHYIEVIRAAADRDEEKILRKSRDLKFLTGFESQSMESLHLQAVLLLGQPFWGPQPFDFGVQGTARGVRGLLPQMLRGRLGPPPEPSYALHRKLGGIFLACAHLGGRVRCREIFLRVYEGYWGSQKAEGGPQNSGEGPQNPGERQRDPRVDAES